MIEAARTTRRLSAAFGMVLLSLNAFAYAADPVQGAEFVFDLKIEGGRVPQSMRVIRLRQGNAVRLRWTSDRPMLLHLHGYDIETKVEPGTVAETAFIAHATGRFSVEEHKPKAQGGHSHGEASLIRIEVRPR